MRQLALTVAILGLGTLAPGGSAGQAKNKDQADGVWRVVAMEQNGKKLPAELIDKLDMKLTIKGDTYTVATADKIIDKGTSTVDATKTPHAIDIKSSEGPNKDKTILAILVIDGDAMKVCYDLDGKARPTEFATKEGSNHVLIHYRRDKKK